MANTILHKAASRGDADHGWLHSRHTFSFADYLHPERMHFGMLRVLNDDEVAAGMGFGTHNHYNMEIISIPLEGDLEHKDSMGNVTVIKSGDEGVWIYQDAWFHLGKFDKDFSVDYTIKKSGNGVYAFILKGDVTIDGNLLNERDGLGIWNTDKIAVKVNSLDAEVLLMEVPMN